MPEEATIADDLETDMGWIARETTDRLFTSEIVILKGKKPLERGDLNLVYEHPHFRGSLIKIYDPDRISDSGCIMLKRQPKRLKFRRRIGAFSSRHRELREVLSLHARLGREINWPIARIFGLVETDIGLGIVVEKITGPDGKLAPTVRHLIRTGEFSPLHRRKLVELFDELERFHVCMHDVHLDNIVLSADAENVRFVAVDGLGTRAAFPIKDWFKWANAISVRKHKARMLSAVDRLLAETNNMKAATNSKAARHPDAARFHTQKSGADHAQCRTIPSGAQSSSRSRLVH